MAKPVLGKSLCSDWFFLGQDFAERTVSNPCIFVLGYKGGKLKICNQNSEKNCEYCYSSQRNYQKKLKRLKFFPNFQRWMKKTNILQASFIILKICKRLMQKLKQASPKARRP